MANHKTGAVGVTRMRQHIEGLAAAYEIEVCTQRVKRTAGAYAIREADGAANVQTPPIRSAITYATALHEIGHILGRHQNSRRSMVREVWAWRWARTNALAWTPAMERHSRAALVWYADRPTIVAAAPIVSARVDVAGDVEPESAQTATPAFAGCAGAELDRD
jgi:hypothetical protein